jgi:hypothetical protein
MTSMLWRTESLIYSWRITHSISLYFTPLVDLSRYFCTKDLVNFFVIQSLIEVTIQRNSSLAFCVYQFSDLSFWTPTYSDRRLVEITELLHSWSLALHDKLPPKLAVYWSMKNTWRSRCRPRTWINYIFILMRQLAVTTLICTGNINGKTPSCSCG